MDPRLSLGHEASRQGAVHPPTAGVHGPPEEVGHCLMGRSHSHGVIQAKASWPFQATIDEALSLSHAPASLPARAVPWSPSAAAAHAAAAGTFPFPPPLTCRGDSSVPRPF